MFRNLPLLFVAMLSACATTDPANFSLLETEVTARIHDGMPLSEANAALSSLGFSCYDGTSLDPKRKDIFECTRSRGPLWPPYACIHRVWFESNISSNAVSNLQIFKPACASL